MSANELARALRGRARPPHPDESAWERFAAGEMAGDERLALIDHALACGPCARTLRALEHLAVASGRRTVGRGVARPGAGRALALAAGLAVAVVGAWWVSAPRPDGDSSRLRAGEAALPALELIAPAGGVARPDLVFRWRPVAGAHAYRIRVYRADGVPFGAVVTRPGIDLPAPELAPEWPAGAYSWRVEALRSGAVVAGSRLADFELAP